MSEPIDLFDYKQRKEGEAVVYAWKCGECEGQEWFIKEEGQLECAGCGNILETITHTGED